MISRHITPALKRAAEDYPVVTLTGPRQSGKTTLVRAVFLEHAYMLVGPRRSLVWNESRSLSRAQLYQ